MKYRIVPSKKGKKLDLIKDPEGENKRLGSYSTIQAAKSALRAIVLGKADE
jgi:hypothetical protein